MTIYDALVQKLGRVPTNDELRSDVWRILGHEHEYRRSKPTSSVEMCSCGKWRHTEYAGPAIVGVAK